MSVNTYIMFDTEYFEVFPFSIGEFTWALYPGELFHRYSWPEITFRNEPLKYKQTLNDAYRLYNLIKAKKFSEDIKIKHVWTDGTDTITVEGIFRSQQCSYEDDDEHKTIKITPTTLDQYTYFLDNWETEVDIMTGGSKNKIINGEFTTWTPDPLAPIAWTFNAGLANIYRKFDRIFAKMQVNRTEYSYLSQTVYINSNQSIQFMFDYAYLYHGMNYLDIRSTRKIRVSLYSGSTYYYLKSIVGTETYEWVTEEVSITIESMMVALRVDYLTGDDENEGMHHKEIISPIVPGAGNLTIGFYLGTNDVILEAQTYFVVGGVKLYANTTTFESITVEIPLNGIDSQAIFDSLHPLDCNPTTEDLLAAQPNWASDPIYCFFLQGGGYNTAMGGDVGFELMNNSYKGTGIQFGSLSNIITEVMGTYDPSDTKLPHYLCELSDITIYQCPPSRKYKWYDAAQYTEYTKFLATCTFTRQIAFTIDDPGHVPVPPDNSETWFDTNIVNPVDNRRKWIRTPLEGTGTWEFYNGTDTPEGINTTKGRINGFDYIQSLSSRKSYVASSTTTFDKAIDLRDVFRILFRSTHATYRLSEAYSTFFWNDNEYSIHEIFDGLKSGLNYVSMDRNFLNNISCIHTTDLNSTIDENTSDNELKISPKAFLDDLKSYFKIYDLGGLYWWIDSGYNFHIEHIKYFDISKLRYDISAYVNRPMKNLKPTSEALFTLITFDQVNSGFKDFHLNKMSFELPVMQGTQKKERTNKTNILTTDLRYCYENPTNLSNGLILINHDGNIAGKKAINGSACGITGKSEPNGNLSLSNILNLFCRYEGMLLNGKINDADVTFENTIRMIDGNEVTAKGVLQGEIFSTPIAKNGLVRTMTHNFNDQTTKVTLAYKSVFEIVVESADDFVGAVDKYLDLGDHKLI